MDEKINAHFSLDDIRGRVNGACLKDGEPNGDGDGWWVMV